MSDARVNCFGHLGDGNLHCNLFPAQGRRREDCEPTRASLPEIPQDLAAMRAIKAALDPLGILNPGAMLRAVCSCGPLAGPS